MLRTLTIISALAALATPALAADVTVKLAGKSPEAVSAEVAKAAASVCRDVTNTPLLSATRSRCVADTVRATEAKLALIYAATPSTVAAR